MKYELPLNAYGNVNGIPEGWHEVNITTQKLKSFGIPFYKANVGWNKRSKRHINPILVNIIPNTYKSVLTKKLNAEVNNKEDKKSKWRERLMMFTGCTEEQASHVERAVIQKKYIKRTQLISQVCLMHSEMWWLSVLNKYLNENPLDYIRSKQQALNLIAEHCK